MSRRACLLLVDLQQDFLARPGLSPPAPVLVEQLAKLLAAWRGLGLPVVHSHTLIQPDGGGRMPHWQRADYWACVVGTPGALPPPALAPIFGETVLDKPFFSAFGNTRLEPLLRELGSEILVVAGIYTHACIRATVLDAYQNHFQVWVAADGIAADDALHADLTLRYLEQRACRFLPGGEILHRLDDRTAVPVNSALPSAHADPSGIWPASSRAMNSLNMHHSTPPATGSAQPTILITSVGSGVGMAVVRALRRSRPGTRIVGVGCEARAAGVYACDAAYLIPPVLQETAYNERLLEIVRQERPAVIIPGHDAELPLLATLKDRLTREWGVFMPIGSREAVSACCDKYRSAQVFAGLAFARSAASLIEARQLTQEVGFPLVVKPRFGYASRGVTVVFDDTALAQAFAVATEPWVAQEYLADHAWGKTRAELGVDDVYRDGFVRQDCDYSVQVLLGRDHRLLGVFASRNRLRHGFPVAMETLDHPALFQTVAAMAERLGQLGLIGPCNFQAIQVAPETFVVYECNARFTGMSDSRAAMGWNECEAVLRHFLDNRGVEEYLDFRPGLCAFRHWSETLCSSADVARLQQQGAWCASS